MPLCASKSQSTTAKVRVQEKARKLSSIGPLIFGRFRLPMPLLSEKAEAQAIETFKDLRSCWTALCQGASQLIGLFLDRKIL